MKRILSTFVLVAVLCNRRVSCQTQERQTPSPDCVPDDALKIKPGDGIDNDCDGYIDEEYCYNGIDEDKDGKFNEDCAALPSCERRGSTKGLEFVLAYMENKPDRPMLTPLELFITRAVPPAAMAKQARMAYSAIVQTPRIVPQSSDDEANIESTNITAQFGANVQGLKLILPDMLRITGAIVAEKGIYVRANATATVQGYNKEYYTSDSFLTFPADSLGDDYYAVTYQTSWLYTQLAVVALYSDTVVTVKLLEDTGDADVPRVQLQWDGKTYSNGDTFKIRLQPFQVVQLQSEQDLTGTHIRSNRPVAFYSGNVRTWIRLDGTEDSVQSRDHLVDQIPPTDTWGTRIITQNYPPHTGEDRIHVIASQPDTRIDVTTRDEKNAESTQRYTLVRPGTSVQIRLKPRNRMSLVASSPVMVTHMTHSQTADEVPPEQFTDPSMIYVTPVDQFDNNYYFGTTNYVPDGDFNATYIMITVKQGVEDSITLDGDKLSALPTPPTWSVISIKGDQSKGEEASVKYVVGYIKVKSGFHRITSSSGKFSAVIWAVGDRNSYAHPLGIRWKDSDCQICKQTICADGVDNDCDGKIDEEACDDTDSDGDGQINEDCACVPKTTTTPSTTAQPTTTKKTTTKRTTTTTSTTTTTTTTTPEVPAFPGRCTLPYVKKNYTGCYWDPRVNIIFINDWVTQRLPTRENFTIGTNFIKRAVANWFQGKDVRFGFLQYSNGVPSIVQNLSPDRNGVIENATDLITYQTIANPSSDLRTALKFVRSHMLPEFNDNFKGETLNVVIALCFGRYTGTTISRDVKWEATMLASYNNAKSFFIGFNDVAPKVRQMALGEEYVTLLNRYADLTPMAASDSDFIRKVVGNFTYVCPANGTVDAYPSPFQTSQVCYGNTASLTCPDGELIKIMTANFGRVNYHKENTCGVSNPISCDASNPACPYLDAYAAVAKLCDKTESCDLTPGSDLFPDLMSRLQATCTPAATYLDVSYLCINFTDPTTCSFTPASRLLGQSNEFQLTASSSASCSACSQPLLSASGARGAQQPSPLVGQCDASNYCQTYNGQCKPSLASFDHSAIEAWCPSLTDQSSPWLTADLGAPFVVLGVVLQGRRRYLGHFVKNVNVYVGNDTQSLQKVETDAAVTLQANGNSTDMIYIPFNTSLLMARLVKVEVAQAADYPALHLEVVINDKVIGCEPFGGINTSLQGKRGQLGTQVIARCIGSTRTREGSAAYSARCRLSAKWSVEKPCN